MKKKKRGAIELVYLLIILGFFGISIKGLYVYYNNIHIITNNVVSIKYDNIDDDNLSSIIMDKIKENNLNDMYVDENTKISIKQITNIEDTTKITETTKNYSNIVVYDTTQKTNIIKKLNKKYFLFSFSKDSINVGYDDTNVSYNLGEINDKYYYGIENTNDLSKTVLYLSPTVTTQRSNVICYEFDKNIEKYNFFIAKIEKKNETIYNIYIKHNNELKEIYSIKDN